MSIKSKTNGARPQIKDRNADAAARGGVAPNSLHSLRDTSQPGAFARPPNLIVIGASAGGPTALMTILSALPADFPAAIVIVQHLDLEFVPGIATWLDEQTAMPVRIASEGERPQVGGVLIAGAGTDLALTGPYTLGYLTPPAGSMYCPSVDVLFSSVARYWKSTAVGILLTGMGRDGAIGLKALRDSGAFTIAQDQATSAVYGMPRAAAEIGAAISILPLNDIAPFLMSRFNRGRDA